MKNKSKKNQGKGGKNPGVVHEEERTDSPSAAAGKTVGRAASAKAEPTYFTKMPYDRSVVTDGERRFATHMPATPDRISQPDGRPNPRYIDFIGDEPQTELPGLDDRPFALVSVLSPEDHLRRQEMFRLEKFVHMWPFLTLMKGMEDFNAFVAHKYNIPHNTLQADFEDFLNVRSQELMEMGAEVEYERFVDTFREQLDKEMEEKHGFKTQVRGFKILGVFKDERSAQDWARQRLALNDAKSKKMPYFLGLMEAGKWTALSPELMRGQVVHTEYMQEELNHLMKHAHANAQARQTEHDRRVNQRKYDQYKKNLALAEATGQKITQVIRPDGTTERTLVSAGGQIEESLEDRTSAGTNVTSGTAPTLMSDLAASIEMRSHTDPSIVVQGAPVPATNF